MNKDYEWLRAMTASYLDVRPEDGVSLLDYAEQLAKLLYKKGADSPASSLMIDMAAYIEHSRKAVSRDE